MSKFLSILAFVILANSALHSSFANEPAAIPSPMPLPNPNSLTLDRVLLAKVSFTDMDKAVITYTLLGTGHSLIVASPEDCGKVTGPAQWPPHDANNEMVVNQQPSASSNFWKATCTLTTLGPIEDLGDFQLGPAFVHDQTGHTSNELSTTLALSSLPSPVIADEGTPIVSYEQGNTELLTFSIQGTAASMVQDRVFESQNSPCGKLYNSRGQELFSVATFELHPQISWDNALWAAKCTLAVKFGGTVPGHLPPGDYQIKKMQVEDARRKLSNVAEKSFTLQ